MGSPRLAARILSMRRSRNCSIVEGNRHKRRTAELGKRDIVTSHCGDGNTRIGASEDRTCPLLRDEAVQAEKQDNLRPYPDDNRAPTPSFAQLFVPLLLGAPYRSFPCLAPFWKIAPGESNQERFSEC